VPASPSPPPARRRTGELAPALVLLIAFAALGSCRALSRIGPGQGRSLALVGDSITDSAAAELRAAAAGADWIATIDATPGAMTVEKQRAAVGLAARRPAVAVINLGTNDSMCIQAEQARAGSCRFPGYDPARRDGELATMARTLRAAGACVIGVVPYVDMGVTGTWGRLQDEGTAQGVADWSAEAAAHRDGYLVDALGHLSDAGRTAYARFVLDAVARTCDPTATAP
jgi:hypothetical protein